jgi:SAM-dependent methyltransferase
MEITTMDTATNDVPALKPADDFEYYTGTIYWNNFAAVCRRINLLISGDENVGWYEHLRRRCGCFDSALIANCGNGWVERDLFRSGVIARAIGFDINSKLVDEARERAAEIQLPSTYHVVDSNRFQTGDLQVDLVVNYAAMHHVAYLNRLSLELVKSLGPEGVYVGFDYVGPHRNQYPWDIWSNIVSLNAALPDAFRATLNYPHLTTMLHSDPTEAIHSELLKGILYRYFDVEQYTLVGGAIAYTLLYNNTALFEAQYKPEGREVIDRILTADSEFTLRMPELNLFSFWIARPKRTPMGALIEIWQSEEDERERRAALSNGGRYYPTEALELIYNELADTRYQTLTQASMIADLQSRLAACSDQIEMLSRARNALLNSTSWRLTLPLRLLKASFRGKRAR